MWLVLAVAVMLAAIVSFQNRLLYFPAKAAVADMVVHIAALSPATGRRQLHEIRKSVVGEKEVGCQDFNAVSHGSIANLTLCPHPHQRWMPGIDKVHDPHVCLAGVLAVQATGILL